MEGFEHLADGRVVVHLFIPFKDGDKTLDAITLGPLTLGHKLKWGAGDFSSSVEFLAFVANLPEKTIRELRRPDDDRVLTSFMLMLWDDVRAAITSGQIPTRIGGGQRFHMDEPEGEEFAGQEAGLHAGATEPVQPPTPEEIKDWPKIDRGLKPSPADMPEPESDAAFDLGERR